MAWRPVRAGRLSEQRRRCSRGFGLARLDVLFTNATPARAKEIDFTQPYIEVEAGFLVPKGSRIAIFEDVDASGVRVGVMDGSTSAVTLPALLKNASVVRVPTIDGVREGLSAGTLDAFATNKSILFEVSDSLPGATVLAGRYGVEQLALGIPRAEMRGCPTRAASWLRPSTAALSKPRWIGLDCVEEPSSDEDHRHPRDHRHRSARSAAAARERLPLGALRPHDRRGRDRRRARRPRRDGRRRRIGGGGVPRDEDVPRRPRPGAPRGDALPASRTRPRRSTTTARRSLAALEFACLDILGQEWGVPVYDILGGSVRDRVPFASYLFFRYAEPRTARARCGRSISSSRTRAS